MTFRDRILPRIDRIRSIPGRLGLHRYRVFVRVTTYGPTPAGRVGLGPVVSDVETELLVGGKPPHVREERSKDVVAGTGEFAEQYFEIGPVTTEFAGGGVTTDTLNPERGSAVASSVVQYRLTGPGLPPTGLLCKRYDGDEDRPFRYMVKVKSMGRRKT